ncbi:MAG: carboxypeptidase regulatory-like domain-containing protein [Acidobacteria bacterium]|nr:carboxypeptidase regulatory-like domain-containing protein [Acidobacteriota bacterium]
MKLQSSGAVLFLMVALAALWFVPESQAATLDLEFILEGSDLTGVVGEVHASPVSMTSSDRHEGVAATAELSRPVALELPAEGVWRVTLRAGGLWAAPTLATVDERAGKVQVRLRRVGYFGGVLKTPRGEVVPEEVKVRLRSPEGGEGHGEDPGYTFPETSVSCPASKERFECELPAGRFDLRVRAKGFVSEYLWGVEVRAAQLKDVGLVTLHRGASLVGRLEVSEGRLVAGACRVSITPFVSGVPEGAGRRRHRELALEAKVGKDGFFHFQDIQPGSYVVEAEQKGFGSAKYFPVTVMENAETELREPLLLEPPVEISVAVNPPRDAFGEPWKWRLYEPSDVSEQLEEVAAGTLSEDGLLHRGGLVSGPYTVVLLDKVGSRFAFETIDLGPRSETLFLDLPVVWMQGDVRLGDEPLEAELLFGGPGGIQQVEVRSGEDGRFSGFLPRDGRWVVRVVSESPPVRRTLRGIEVEDRLGEGMAEISLRLPDTEIRGKVVDGDGAPVFAATVRVVELDALSHDSTRTDRDGSFLLRGFGEGSISVVAEDGEARSDQVTVHLTEAASTPPVRLVIREDVAIRGRVVSSSGGVPGAKILAGAFGPGGRLMLFGDSASTDIEGTFELKAPSAASHLQLAVFAPGYALALVRLEVGSPEPVVVDVQPDGGALTLDFGAESDRRAGPPLQPVVFAEGMILDGNVLQAWARFNKEPNDDPSRWVVPALPPGSYSACLIAVGADTVEGPLNASQAGCVEGFLPPGGDLSLTPTSPALASS